MEVYLDNSATTRAYDCVGDLVRKVMCQDYGNPSSMHAKGVQAEHYIKETKEILAKLLKVKDKEIVFTSGGTESDNLALIGAARANRRRGNHLITSSIEHPAILNTMRYLEEEEDFRVTFLPVDRYGRVNLEALKEALCPETILVSIMYVNNEVGSVQPVQQAADIVKAYNKDILFHVDAVQGFGKYRIYPKKEKIDMLSLSGHKIHGPKGIGFLYIGSGLKLGAFMHGGAQERRRRGGTENVPGIAGMGRAAQLALLDMEERQQKERQLRDYLIDRVLKEGAYTRLNGHRTRRLGNNANFAFQFIEGESLLIMLDMEGICGSSGSACTSGSLDPSHVLLAIGLPHEIAHGSLRLTVSAENTKEEMDRTVEAIKAIVQKLRNMSPLYEDFMRRSGGEGRR